MKRIVVLVAAVVVGCESGAPPEIVNADGKRPLVKVPPPPAEGAARFFARGTSGDAHELQLRKLTVDVSTQPGTVHSHLNVEIATLADGQSEAVLRLPVPRGAAVTNAVLWVNDKPMRGAFVERQRANDIYTSIVTRRRDPALITWDGPGWIAVSIFPLEKDRTRRLELDWIEPAAVADGRIQYRVPIVAEHDRLIGRASVKVNGKKVSTTTQELVAIAPADPRKVFARRVPGDPFQQMMVREPAADGPPHFVLIAETSAALGIVDRGRQRAALDVLLDGLPPDAKMTLLAADWDVTPLVEDAGSAAWPDALAKLDAIPSAGALHLERALHEAIERARKTNAPAILFVGVGGDGFNGDATAAPLAELRAAHLRLSALSVGGADVPQPLAKATADTGGEAIVLRSFEDVQPPLLDALRPRPSQPVLDARGDGEWHQLKTVTGGTVWIGHGLAAGIAADADTVRADAGSTLATDLASLWQRARLELHDRGVTDEAARTVTPVTSLLVLETDEDYRRFGLAIPAPVETSERAGTIRRREGLYGLAGNPGAANTAVAQEQTRNEGVLSALKASENAQLEFARSIQAAEARKTNPSVASVFGLDRSALGSDAQSVLGALAGGQVGEAYGVGGLGLVGTGVGGGGTGEHTLGLGNLGTIGAGGPGSSGNGSGYGRGAGAVGSRRAIAPDVVPGQLTVRGNMDKEIIRRIVRRHINEVRTCYEQQLAREPRLRGRVVVQFTIAATGTVLASVMQSSTLASPSVETCVVNAVKRWEFPYPLGGGLVIVTYPFSLTPAGGEDIAKMAPAPPRPIDDALALLSVGAGHERIERVALTLVIRPVSNAEALAWTIDRRRMPEFGARQLVARLLEFAHRHHDAVRVLTEGGAAYPAETAGELRRIDAPDDAAEVERLAKR